VSLTSRGAAAGECASLRVSAQGLRGSRSSGASLIPAAAGRLSGHPSNGAPPCKQLPVLLLDGWLLW